MTQTGAGRGRWACLGGAALLTLATVAVLLAHPAPPDAAPAVPVPSPAPPATAPEGDGGGKTSGGDR
jgi:hypothetical protein